MRIPGGGEPRSSGGGSGPHAQLQIAHASMQFSDTPDEKKRDAERIFDRASRKGWSWMTGTEAGGGSGPLRELLKTNAQDHGFRFWMHPAQDSWFAVDRKLIAGGWDTYYERVIPGEARKHTAKGVLAVGFETAELGRVNLIACHFLTKGRPSAKDPAYRQHVAENAKLAKRIGTYAKKVGAGTALVFYGGDQNIVDRTDDTFFGQPLTSCWDELNKYPNTGHGNIDVIASYDRDRRVRALGAWAYDDRDFRLATDHFLIEARYSVRKLGA